MSGRGQVAERMADLADRASFSGRTPDGAASFESQRALLRAAMCRHGARDMLANASLAVAAEGPGSPWQPQAMFLLGGAHFVLGDPDLADTWLAQSVDVGRRVGSANLAPLALRALVRIMHEEWGEAADYAEQSWQELRARHYEGLAQAVLTYAALARVAVHRGDHDLAREILVRAQLVRPIAQAIPWISVLALTHLARAYIAVSDVSGARQAMREAEDLVRRQPLLGNLSSELLATRKELEGAMSALAGPSSLTAAELRVLLLLPTYLSFEEIGERLVITRNTVKSHAMSIYGKLQASSRGEAVERAVELGLLEPYPALRSTSGRDGGSVRSAS
jgi:LuxR family maltose regulon positive regulatory protein